MMAHGRDLLERCVPVLASYHQAGSALHHLETRHRANLNAGRVLSDLKAQLTRLVPENFPELYDADRVDHLPRYIKAIETRAQRAVTSMDKDQTKAMALKPVTDALEGLLDKLTPAVSGEKRKAVEEYFWMIEEYKVSLFAQELKTATPISKKRLEKKLADIRRMV